MPRTANSRPEAVLFSLCLSLALSWHPWRAVSLAARRVGGRLCGFAQKPWAKFPGNELPVDALRAGPGTIDYEVLSPTVAALA